MFEIEFYLKLFVEFSWQSTIRVCNNQNFQDKDNFHLQKNVFNILLPLKSFSYKMIINGTGKVKIDRKFLATLKYTNKHELYCMNNINKSINGHFQ